jgi:nitrate/nitrite transporter NarK
VFWINVPIGFLGAVIGWFVIPVSKDLPADRRFDWAGAALIVPALTTLMIVLNEGHAWGVTSPALVAAVLLAAVLLVLFVRCERRAPAPLIDLGLLRERAFAAGNVAGFLAYAALFGILFLMPFVFIRVYADSALVAGLRLTIVPAMLGAVAPIGGALADKLGPRPVALCGMVVCVAALALLSVAMDGVPGSMPWVMVALALFGIGQGLFISPNNSAIMAAAPASLTGEAGGLLNVARFLGIGSGIAASSSLLSLRLQAITGAPGGTVHAPVADLIAAGGGVVLLIAGLAVAAGAISLLGSRRAAAQRA